MAVKAIQSQLAELLMDPPPGVNAGPVDDEDMFTWTGMIKGPPGTPYEDGLFFLDIKFPDNYPWAPPKVKFRTPVHHMNINEKGDICMSILFADCSWDRGWSPALSITSVLLSLTILLQEPNPDHPLRPELAKQYLADREAFDRVAREHTRQHAK